MSSSSVIKHSIEETTMDRCQQTVFVFTATKSLSSDVILVNNVMVFGSSCDSYLSIPIQEANTKHLYYSDYK